MPAPLPVHRIPMAPVRICRRPKKLSREVVMLDAVFVILGLAWFALCLGYASGCERL